MSARWRRCCAAVAIGAACAGLAHAENHALIMTLDYGATKNPLPATGIEIDGRMAREMAVRMGVPDDNIVWVRNGSLTVEGMDAAFQSLIRGRVHEGDKVFIYYSGHGMQFVNTGDSASKCSEAMVSADLEAFSDARIESALAALAALAAQVIVMNDSCYSGGQATRELGSDLREGEVVKRYVPKTESARNSAYQCDRPVNRALTRSLGVVERRGSSRMMYIAATADNEASLATPLGSMATLAWHQCLAGGSADGGGSGVIDGDELRRCSQRLIDGAGRRHRQTITLVGDGALPLSFAGPESGKAAPPR